jgi:predicted O-methyltransferase YrrM
MVDKYLQNLNKKALDLSKLKEYAKENNVPIIQDEALDVILAIIKLNDIRNILEIGTAIGYSAINMASVNKNIKVTTLERDPKMVCIAKENIKKYGLDKQIEVIEIDALEYHTNKEYDLIFIDGAKAQYIKFFEKYKNNLKKNGFIISDNLFFHNYIFKEKIESKNIRQLVSKIKVYNEYLKESNEFITHFLSVGDGIAISKKIK